MTMLLSSPDPVDYETVVDECLTFIFAGFDTTSTLLVKTSFFVFIININSDGVYIIYANILILKLRFWKKSIQ